MRNYIQILIASSWHFCCLAQNNVDLDQKEVVKGLVEYFNIYKYYTTLKSNYSVDFQSLSQKYFVIDSLEKNKVWSIEEISDRLDSIGLKDLAANARDLHLNYVKRIADTYSTAEFEAALYRKRFEPPWQGYPFIILNDSVIDVQTAFWQNQSGRYRLRSGVDTIIRFNPWKPAWRVQRKYVDKQVILFYHNIADSSFSLKLRDSLRNEKIKNENGISVDIYGLVNSPFLKSESIYESSVPAILRDWISESLESLKAILPHPWSTDVSQMKLSFEHLPGEKLWIKSDNDQIYLSPFLVRAVYLKGIYNRFRNDLNYINGEIEYFRTARKRRIEDDLAVYNAYKEIFQREFIFLLLHELAHPIVNKLNISDVEERCDCLATKVILTRNIRQGLGIFENILIQAIKEGTQNLWDINDQQAIINRLNLIKNEKGELTVASCNYLQAY